MLIKSKFEGYAKGGIRLYPCDDGGGGGGSTTQTQDLPDWAKPYAKDVLGVGSALSFNRDTDPDSPTYQQITGIKPYQQYGGERLAGFEPLQNKAFQGAELMAPSAVTGQGAGLAGQATQRALGTMYDPYATGQFGAQAGQYMDPYMQNVVDIQQREADRAAGIAGTQRSAQAVQSGAFGGSRQAIMDAEAARNLAMQKGDIQARGLQDAYTRGLGQFNTEQQLREQSRQYGAGLGLQGLQTALSGAGQMGTLGQQQFQQGMDVNKLQAGYGAQQQQQKQLGLDQQYEAFLAEKRHPYQQLEFQSNLLRGTPSGSTQTMYTAPPSTASQLAGLGTAAYGASKLMGSKKGGVIKAPDNRNKKPGGLMALALDKMGA